MINNNCFHWFGRNRSFWDRNERKRLFNIWSQTETFWLIMKVIWSDEDRRRRRVCSEHKRVLKSRWDHQSPFEVKSLTGQLKSKTQLSFKWIAAGAAARPLPKVIITRCWKFKDSLLLWSDKLSGFIVHSCIPDAILCVVLSRADDCQCTWFNWVAVCARCGAVR